MARVKWIWLVAILTLVVLGITRYNITSATPLNVYEHGKHSIATCDNAVEHSFSAIDAYAPQWRALELPAPRYDGYYPNAERICIRANGIINYTFYYDFDTYTSMWVAYTLEAQHMGDFERPSRWEYNPQLSTSDQVNLRSHSYSDTYSRGHLIPNASRDGDPLMQEQTFYVTNSVPQVQNGFNGGIWYSLERALQGVAMEERIYVVTGVAFEKMGEERIVTYTSAKDEPLKPIPVPNYFYKVALKVKYNYFGEIVDARTIGFWFENRSHKGSFESYAYSVDTIEAWTGFDFFHALDDNIEIRAEQNAKWHIFERF